MSFAKKLEAGLVKAVGACVSLLMGLFSGIALIVPFFKELMGLTLIGAILIALRALFLAMIPFLIKFSHEIAVYVTYVMADLAITLDAIKAAIFGIVEVVAAIDHFFHGHMKKPSVPNFIKPKAISAREVRKTLTKIAETCTEYGGIAPIWKHVVRDLSSPKVCPYLRAVYPLGPDTWYKYATSLFGWLSYDSEPYPGANCPTPPSSPEWVCVGLGAGYILLELLLPILIVGIFLYSARGGIAKLLTVTIHLGLYCGELIIDLIFKLVSKL